ncbi:imidazolonepropionase-like amidohydrolase [Tamaricihabitans halophyticus]|uniref:Imidazolonepropionase-like amidohydrolase n=1 Tax=Tamaricihabitans halophyticus TaxID=1262583 RepID=A0A4R2R6N5_9PSEU|nr:amidohydrolase family protein [Tamaricihabitans halophyticus]TCP57518.1 imidazolonepropionase-like amidohydrolase [Tamaricihabitans halophyticus]
MQRIEADLLIPGSGEPIPNGVVVLDGAVISYAGPAAGAPGTPDTRPTRCAAVLPGLWDCHTHLVGLPTLDFERMALTSDVLRAARSVTDLGAALDVGVTSIREVGGLGLKLAQAVAEGSIAGPTIYAAGAVLSTTGGHGDVHSLPLDWMHDLTERSGDFRLCDGVSDCMRAVREQLRGNAKVIKVCASGGVLSEVDDPIHQQFTAAELRAIVEVAGLAERAVAAHCHGKPGIMAALAAGVQTIEHGTYLDEEACDAMREQGAILVATRTIIDDLLHGAQLPDYALRKLRGVADRHAEALTMAYERGVTIAAGSDIALAASGRLASWGRHGREISLLAQAGMSPLQAIEAATATAPKTLGAQAPRSGQLLAGYDADVLALDANPLADLNVLTGSAHVLGVWQSGVRKRERTPEYPYRPTGIAVS